MLIASSALQFFFANPFLAKLNDSTATLYNTETLGLQTTLEMLHLRRGPKQNFTFKLFCKSQHHYKFKLVAQNKNATFRANPAASSQSQQPEISKKQNLTSSESLCNYNQLYDKEDLE